MVGGSDGYVSSCFTLFFFLGGGEAMVLFLVVVFFCFFGRIGRLHRFDDSSFFGAGLRTCVPFNSTKSGPFPPLKLSDYLFVPQNTHPF